MQLTFIAELAVLFIALSISDECLTNVARVHHIIKIFSPQLVQHQQDNISDIVMDNTYTTLGAKTLGQGEFRLEIYLNNGRSSAASTPPGTVNIGIKK